MADTPTLPLTRYISNWPDVWVKSSEVAALEAAYQRLLARQQEAETLLRRARDFGPSRLNDSIDAYFAAAPTGEQK